MDKGRLFGAATYLDIIPPSLSLSCSLVSGPESTVELFTLDFGVTEADTYASVAECCLWIGVVG